jgi:type I restriction enzyme S subunit
MAGEWEKVPLGELYDFSSGLSKPRSEFGFGHGFLSFKDVFYNYFAPPRLEQLVNSTEKEQQICSIKRGDVFLTRTSETMDELGMSCVALCDYDRATFNGFTKRLRPKSSTQIIPEYAGYYFRSPFFRREVTAMSSLSTRASLNNEMLGRLTMAVPPPNTQVKIGAVLKALDDKIELNRRMNASLEATARALFQSWFVDFDPVRAKLDGRQAVGLDPDTAALFPNSFQDSEAGHIPKGWTIHPIGEVVDCVGGGTPSTAEPMYWEGGTHHWATPKDLSSLKAPVLLDTDRKLTDAGIAKISSGLLPAGTLLLSSRAPVGYLAIAAMPVAINQGFIALKCNERVSSFFMLSWCQMNMAEIESRATGTTFAEISKQNFRPIHAVLPPKQLMAAFTAKAALLYDQVIANLHQSRTLTALRDNLLPKLISGELKISDVDQFLASSTR